MSFKVGDVVEFVMYCNEPDVDPPLKWSNSGELDERYAVKIGDRGIIERINMDNEFSVQVTTYSIVWLDGFRTTTIYQEELMRL